MECKGSGHLKNVSKKVIKSGGEGIILRKFGSLYERGRSASLLKLKVFFLSSPSPFLLSSLFVPPFPPLIFIKGLIR